MEFPWLSMTTVVFHDFSGVQNSFLKFHDFPRLCRMRYVAPTQSSHIYSDSFITMYGFDWFSVILLTNKHTHMRPKNNTLLAVDSSSGISHRFNVGVQNPARARERRKFWMYPYWGIQNPQFGVHILPWRQVNSHRKVLQRQNCCQLMCGMGNTTDIVNWCVDAGTLYWRKLIDRIYAQCGMLLSSLSHTHIYRRSAWNCQITSLEYSLPLSYLIISAVYCHTRLTHSYLLSGDDILECGTCQCPLTVKHILMDCVDFNDVRNKHFVVSLVKDLFENVVAQNIIHFIKKTRLYKYL